MWGRQAKTQAHAQNNPHQILISDLHRRLLAFGLTLKDHCWVQGLLRPQSIDLVFSLRRHWSNLPNKRL